MRPKKKGMILFRRQKSVDLLRLLETPGDVNAMVEYLVGKGGNREAIWVFLGERKQFNSGVSQLAQGAGNEVAQLFPGDNLASITGRTGKTETEIRQEISAQIAKYLSDYLQVGIQIGGRGMVELRPGWTEARYHRQSYDITACSFDPSRMRDGAMGPLERYLTDLIPLEGGLIQQVLTDFGKNRQEREELFNQAIQSRTLKVDPDGIISFSTAETN